MNLEVFKEIVQLLKEQQEKLDTAYKAGVDLINFCDPMSTAVGHLVGSLYGKEEKDQGKQVLDMAHGSVEYRDICFTYPETNKLILDHVSFNIAPGQVVS